MQLVREPAVGHVEPEQRAEAEQRRRCREGLGPVRLRVLDRKLGCVAREAGEQLGQPELERGRGVDEGEDDAGRLGAEAVAPHALGDDRAVVWPDGVVVVLERTVRGLVGGERPNPPPRPELVAEQPRHGGGGLLVADDPAPEQMAHVRCGGVNLSLPPVERQREVAALVDPKVALEPLLEVVRLRLEPPRERLVAPELACEPGRTQPRVVRVALQLAGRDRRLRHPAVAEADRVARVLPSLVVEADRRALYVLDVAVAVEVGVACDPLDRAPRRRLELAHEVPVAGPALVLVEQDQEQHGRVVAAVVVAGVLAEPRELAAP